MDKLVKLIGNIHAANQFSPLSTLRLHINIATNVLK